MVHSSYPVSSFSIWYRKDFNYKITTLIAFYVIETNHRTIIKEITIKKTNFILNSHIFFSASTWMNIVGLSSLSSKTSIKLYHTGKTRTRDPWDLTVTWVTETLCWIFYRWAYIWNLSSTLYINLINPLEVMKFTIPSLAYHYYIIIRSPFY